MITLTATSAIETYGGNVPDDFIGFGIFGPTLVPGDATSAKFHDDFNNIDLVMTGTDIGSDSGIITSLTFKFGSDELYTVTGLSLAYGDFTAAVSSWSVNRPDGVAEMFDGLDWSVDLSAFSSNNILYGTGGDDSITSGAGSDVIMLDGGHDRIDAGAGDDRIYADNSYGFSALGTTTLTGGEGNDTLLLYFPGQTQASDEEMFTKGLTVVLGGENRLGVFHVELDSVENIVGTAFNDRFFGDNADNSLNGRGGDDILNGGHGLDRLNGGQGADAFVYLQVADSRRGANHDVILDFQHKVDEIDVSFIDSGTKNGKFHFIGDDKFGKHAGELHVLLHDEKGTKNDYTMVEGDTDGDGKANLQIELDGLVHLDKGDFQL